MRMKITFYMLLSYFFLLNPLYAQENYQMKGWGINSSSVVTKSEHYTSVSTVAETDAGIDLKGQTYTLSGGFLQYISEDKEMSIAPIIYLLLN